MFPVKSVQELGRLVRQIRKKKGLTQKEAAALCGVGTRFLSELENGKETLQTGKVFYTAKIFGIELMANEK